MKIVNCTPHDIVLNNGTVYKKTEHVARIKTTYTPIDERGFCHKQNGGLYGLPESEPKVYYIVSLLIFDECERGDLICPLTFHSETIRDERGYIVSVPGFMSH